METKVVEFHKRLHITAIKKIALHLPILHILGAHHCVNARQEVFNSHSSYHGVLWRKYYLERVVDSFAHQIQSKYYIGNRYVSI